MSKRSRESSRHWRLLPFAVAVCAPGRRCSAAAVERRLYVADDGGGVRVYDIDRGHQFVRTIAVPNSGVYKGIAASVSLGRLYLTSNAPDTLICLDLATDREVWRKTLGSYADSPDITPDGKTSIRALSARGQLESGGRRDGTGQGDHCGRARQAIRNRSDCRHRSAQHVDEPGRHARLSRSPDRAVRLYCRRRHQHASREDRALQQGHSPICRERRRAARLRQRRRAARVRDWRRWARRLDGAGRWCSASRHGFRHPGWRTFQRRPRESRTARRATGSTSRPTRRKSGWSTASTVTSTSSTLRKRTPQQIAAIPLFASATERPHPGWVSFSIDGRFAYPDGGAVIDTKTKTVVARIPTTEKLIEIDFDGTRAVAAGRR